MAIKSELPISLKSYHEGLGITFPNLKKKSKPLFITLRWETPFYPFDTDNLFKVYMATTKGNFRSYKASLAFIPINQEKVRELSEEHGSGTTNASAITLEYGFGKWFAKHFAFGDRNYQDQELISYNPGYFNKGIVRGIQKEFNETIGIKDDYHDIAFNLIENIRHQTSDYCIERNLRSLDKKIFEESKKILLKKIKKMKKNSQDICYTFR